MNAAEIDIEQIIREVIRRLREAATESSKDSTAAETQRVTPSLSVADRIVTLATLDGKLTGIQTLTVPVRAIITPAARDELHQRKITIERGAPATTTAAIEPPASSELAVGVTASSVCEVELRKMLGKSMEVVDCKRKDLAASVKMLVATVVAGARGVLITSTPAAATMLANRTSGVRAAFGFSFPAIRRAKEEIDANLLVIEPVGRSVAELAGMIGEFARK